METTFMNNTSDLVNNSNFTISTVPNDSNITMHSCPQYNFPIVILLTQILYALVCIIGLLGNTLVIYVVLRFSKMQTVTNMYIVNLAIADECFLIGIPFLITTMTLQRWIFGEIMCKVYMITTSINQFTSSIFLFIMSADRYIAVCHPISSPKLRTPFISRIVSVAAWSTSALFMVPISIYSKTINGGKTCNIYWPDDVGNPQKTFTLYSFLLGFALPLAMILIFYCLVIRKLQTVGPKNKSKEKKRSHRKVTKLVLTVITVYIFCWFPYWIAQMALIFGPEAEGCESRLTVFFFLFTGCLSYSNSAMNPILYAFLSDNFKKSFLKACTCAAGKDVNATLHMENSVFPRRHQQKTTHSAKQPQALLGGSSDTNNICGGTTTGGAPSSSGSNLICVNRAGGTTSTCINDDDDDDEEGDLNMGNGDNNGDGNLSAMTELVCPLVTKNENSRTMTSRSNITDSKESSCTTGSKNGVPLINLQPTQV